ncbi:MAG: enoyl-CoA hydratase/isomerase family protein [Acidimicrobiia bacterium]
MNAPRVQPTSHADGVVELTFHNPPINMYDVRMRDEVCEILGALIVDESLRAVVFTATGDHFSAGADLREFGTAPNVFAMRDARWGRDVWGLLQAVPAPMIVAMQGNSVGFGFELALHCDVRIAADDCTVALPEARVGMIPVGGATQTLPRIVGNGAALHAVLTGARFPAADALARGFVDEVVPRAVLREHALTRAAALAARPPAAVRAAKALARAALDLPLPVGLAREADVAAALRLPG